MLEFLKCDDCWPQAGGHTGIIVSVKLLKQIINIHCNIGGNGGLGGT